MANDILSLAGPLTRERALEALLAPSTADCSRFLRTSASGRSLTHRLRRISLCCLRRRRGDSEDALLAGGVVLDACVEARIARRRAGYITETTMELVDNALIHGASAPDRPVVAVSSFGRERTVEIAVVDAGTAISEADDPTAVLRTIPGRALAGERGFLGLILSKGASAGVDVQVQILAGTGRLRWTPRQHRTERRHYVPGMTVIARIAGTARPWACRRAQPPSLLDVAPRAARAEMVGFAIRPRVAADRADVVAMQLGGVAERFLAEAAVDT